MRILGLDLGERRIGVAVSDPVGIVAHPLQTIERRSRSEDFARIAALVAEYQVELVLVGLPLTLRGEVGPQARQYERYAQALAGALPVPLRMWDERYSTVEATRVLQQIRKKSHSLKRGEVDAVAAAVILQSFLDSQAAQREDENGAWERSSEGQDGF